MLPFRASCTLALIVNSLRESIITSDCWWIRYRDKLLVCSSYCYLQKPRILRVVPVLTWNSALHYMITPTLCCYRDDINEHINTISLCCYICFLMPLFLLHIYTTQRYNYTCILQSFPLLKWCIECNSHSSPISPFAFITDALMKYLWEFDAKVLNF